MSESLKFRMDKSLPIVNKLKIFALLLMFLVITENTNVLHRRFEYKYSFKPPYLAQTDGSVPFWEYGGNAIASAENVRIAPSMRSQKGAIWTKNPINFDWWEVEIAFRVTGRGRIGADGLAFWFTQQKGAYNGDVFGSSDKWNGLAVFFDSFDNDNKHNNPYIMAVLNDGTQEFDHQNDGTTQLSAGCLRDFRNKPFPTRAKIEYFKNTLTLLFNNGMTNNEQDYEMCFRVENIMLPKNGYFGLSAATGGLADDHDVIHFLTTSLYTGEQDTVSSQVTGEEQQKLNQEYQEYQQKLQKQRDEYRKEHPDEYKEPNVDDWFETDSQRELRQIFQGQSKLFDVIKQFERKFDEIIGRQERTLSLLSQGLGGKPAVAGSIDTGAALNYDTIKRHEIDSVFTNQNQILGALQELRQSVTDVRSKTDRVIDNQGKQPTAQVHSIGYDMQSFISEVRDSLNHLKGQIGQNKGAPTQTKGDSGCTGCISIITIIVIAIVQVLILLGYSLYRDNKEHQAKKFY